MTPHHTGPTHKPTRRRETAAVRLARLEAEAREREREARELLRNLARVVVKEAGRE